MALSRARRVARYHLHSSRLDNNINKVYYIKNVYYGNNVDTYDYRTIKVSHKTTRTDYAKKKQYKKSDFATQRAREKLYRIVKANCERFKDRQKKRKAVFFTLTTKDQVTDYKESNKKINIGETSSLPLENNQKDMAWKKYNEDGHNEYTPSIDMDGEPIADAQTKETEENKKITHNLKALGELRGLPFLDVPTQRKFYKQLLTLGYTHMEIAEQFDSLLDSEYWKEQKKKFKKLPDMKSLYSNLKNIAHE